MLDKLISLDQELFIYLNGLAVIQQLTMLPLQLVLEMVAQIMTLQ